MPTGDQPDDPRPPESHRGFDGHAAHHHVTRAYWRRRLPRDLRAKVDARAQDIGHGLAAQFKNDARTILHLSLSLPILSEERLDVRRLTWQRLDMALPKLSLGLMGAYVEAVKTALEPHLGDGPSSDRASGVAARRWRLGDVDLLPRDEHDRHEIVEVIHATLNGFDWPTTLAPEAFVPDIVRAALSEHFAETLAEFQARPEDRRYWRSRLPRPLRRAIEPQAAAIDRAIKRQFGHKAHTVLVGCLALSLVDTTHVETVHLTRQSLERALPKLSFGLLGAYLEAIRDALSLHGGERLFGRGWVGWSGFRSGAVDLLPHEPDERHFVVDELHRALCAFEWPSNLAPELFVPEAVRRALTDDYLETAGDLLTRSERDEAELFVRAASQMALESPWMDRLLGVGGAAWAIADLIDGPARGPAVEPAAPADGSGDSSSPAGLLGALLAGLERGLRSVGAVTGSEEIVFPEDITPPVEPATLAASHLRPTKAAADPTKLTTKQRERLARFLGRLGSREPSDE